MITQSLTRPITGRFGGAKNAFAIKAFADRGMEAGETLWAETIATEVAFHSGLAGSLGSSPIASTGCEIAVKQNDVEVGRVIWANNATKAHFSWTSDITFSVGDVISFVVVDADETLADFTITLVGEVIA
ncbi:hypothetical protein AB6E53_02255 [Vibrio breoganii]|uniref:Uncharacterized protein n=1 Tax=Vibrio breoganii TaxID=553239 RepID=A0AAP8SWK0_9VIBR|nr:hypothetical protein [Vibrio breoganii]PMP10209.1 hypothetical protein BCS93_11075 [Vibrio breoganii]